MLGILRQLDGSFQKDWIDLLEDGLEIGKANKDKNGPDQELFEAAGKVLVQNYKEHSARQPERPAAENDTNASKNKCC